MLIAKPDRIAMTRQVATSEPRSVRGRVLDGKQVLLAPLLQDERAVLATARRVVHDDVVTYSHTGR